MSLEEGRLRLRKKWREILRDLDPREVCDPLYQDRILNQSDLELIYDDKILRKIRCRHLLLKVFVDKNAETVSRFFQCLSQQNYTDLCKGGHHQESQTDDDVLGIK